MRSYSKDTVVSIGGKIDFAFGYLDGIMSGFTQTPPKGKSYLVSEQAYDEGLIRGNLTVYAADIIGTFISGAGTGAAATASVVAIAGGGYVVVPETAALTGVLATTVYFAGRAKNDADRLKDSMEEWLDGDEDGSNSKTITSQSQMQKQVERGQAPKEVDRVDKPHVPGQQPHVHFKDGTSLNQDGTIHDAHRGIPNISNNVREWITQNGWEIKE